MIDNLRIDDIKQIKPLNPLSVNPIAKLLDIYYELKITDTEFDVLEK